MTSSTTTRPLGTAVHADTPARVEQRAWSIFRVRPVRVATLSPHLVRVSFGTDPHPPAGSATLREFADNGYDQRIKLILPPAGGDLNGLSGGADWYRRLRGMPEATRPVVRTYTVRAVRSAGTEDAQVDVDLVLHGVAGPASAWASRLLADGARLPAFQAALLGPDARFVGWHGGLEFVTDVTDDLLIVGDETAMPAIAGILERLPKRATGTVLIEVPEPGDRLDLAAPDGMRIDWLPRNGVANGAMMTAAALGWRPGDGDPQRGLVAEVSDPDGWDELAWEVPSPEGGDGIRAWVAGEASAVRTIRRHLVGPCGLDREHVAFMGYWRLGRAEE